MTIYDNWLLGSPKEMDIKKLQKNPAPKKSTLKNPKKIHPQKNRHEKITKKPFRKKIDIRKLQKNLFVKKSTLENSKKNSSSKKSTSKLAKKIVPKTNRL